MFRSHPQFNPLTGAVVVIGLSGAVVVGLAVVIGLGRH